MGNISGKHADSAEYAYRLHSIHAPRAKFEEDEAEAMMEGVCLRSTRRVVGFKGVWIFGYGPNCVPTPSFKRPFTRVLKFQQNGLS